jgi:hypothetical protein
MLNAVDRRAGVENGKALPQTILDCGSSSRTEKAFAFRTENIL